MQGTVHAINLTRGMVAVQVDGFFSIIELLGDEVEIGDELRFGDYPLGGDWCRNLTKGNSLDVYFQNHEVPLASLPQQLLYADGNKLVMSHRLAQCFQPARTGPY